MPPATHVSTKTNQAEQLWKLPYFSEACSTFREGDGLLSPAGQSDASPHTNEDQWFMVRTIAYCH